MSYRTAAYTVLLLALIGLGDSTYLTTKHYLGESVPCSITEGCDTVLTSPFATYLGIPTALWGALYYLALVLLVALFLQTHSSRILGLAFGLATGGLLVSATLIYVQGFILSAWCFYCLISALTTLLIFLTLIFSRPA